MVFALRVTAIVATDVIRCSAYYIHSYCYHCCGPLTTAAASQSIYAGGTLTKFSRKWKRTTHNHDQVENAYT
jgi:hypothetical protein